MRGRASTFAIVAASCAAATIAPATLPASAVAPPVAPSQPVAILRTATVVLAAPRVGARRLEMLPPDRPITGEPTTLPIDATQVVATQTWLRVRLPGRPNGRRGWIRRASAQLDATPWHLVVDRQQRLLHIFERGREVRVFPTVVGKPSTPTPRGSFFVEETVALPPNAPGAPVALALSARSNVLQEFDGGPGQIAIHGTNNVGGIPGTAVSHGCVRVSTAAIEWLAARIGPGVPVTIR